MGTRMDGFTANTPPFAEARLTAVADDVPVEAVRGVGALEERGQLRVPDTRLPTGRADAARPDADLHDVRAAEEELLGHLGGHDVAGGDRVPRERLASAAHGVAEKLRSESTPTP